MVIAVLKVCNCCMKYAVVKLNCYNMFLYSIVLINMRASSLSALHAYIETTFVEESPFLTQVRLRGEQVNPGMQISPAEGKWLSLLVQMIRAKHVLEIGTFVGYSALWMASALPEGGTVTTLEGSTHQASLARAHFVASPYPERLILKEGMAISTLREMLTTSPSPQYDMVFIDASKCDYAEFLELTTPMLREGGLMVADNTLLFGHMAGEPQKDVSEGALTSMRSFNEIMGKSGQFASVLLPTEEGMTIGIKIG
jgi:predicted O-methyltransferase YrrM